MKFIIGGGKPLRGEIQLAGAKNAATKMMIASLLSEEPCTLENFPQIGDAAITGELCRNIGSNLEYADSVLTIHTPEIKNNRVAELSRRNRLPILAMGPLLARTGEAEVPVLGGDKIGPRPVDLHVEALTALGAQIETTANSFYGRAPAGLRGAKISFRFPSVGATENAILAAVLAKGKTILKNCALEPELIDLIKFLQKMGALIELGADRTIFVEGVQKLHGARHRIVPDRNEAVSFACLAIATDGEVLVRGAEQDHLITFLNTVRRLGGEYEVVQLRAAKPGEVTEGIIFRRAGARLRPLNIETSTHPGFMTDWQQPLAVLLTQAEGDSVIHETIYEDRFGYAEDLNSLGANIKADIFCPEGSTCHFAGKNFKHVAYISAPTPLRGGLLKVRDLRSGIAHVIAALVARGESTIEGVEEIDRGYEKIDERLRNLGAEIRRT